jgi:poly-beta-1,6-N-acetyl-D-glucosamine synthase
MSLVTTGHAPVAHRAATRPAAIRPLPPAGTGEARVVVLVPAHNEEDQLPGTITSLRGQTQPPDEIVVVSDNSTDRTAEVARSLGVTVFETVDNASKKAGAINQALSHFMDSAPDAYILVMDADTELSPEWIQTAARELAGDPKAAVGGTYLGKPGRGVVPQLQINEFVRASRLQYRKRPTSIWCLSGTGTMARASMLREVADSRGRDLPGRYGDVYDSGSATEDFELTLATRTLGYRCVIPKGCESRTEVMPTMRTWFKQRLRWQFGTLDSLLNYGFSRVTWGWKGWARQGLFHLRFLAQFALWFVLVHALMTSGATFPAYIVACLCVVYAERLVSVWGAGWRGRLLAMLVLPEFLYGISEGAYLIAAIWKIARRTPLSEWGHVQQGGV